MQAEQSAAWGYARNFIIVFIFLKSLVFLCFLDKWFIIRYYNRLNEHFIGYFCLNSDV